MKTLAVPKNSLKQTMPELYVAKKSRQPKSPRSFRVTRIEKTEYYNHQTTDFENTYSAHPKEFLVIEDMDMGYRVRGKQAEWENMLSSWSQNASAARKRKIRNIVLLGRSLKELISGDGTLWGTLLEDHRDETLIVVNADLLRSMGAEISRRISWERTAQDLVNFLHSTSQFANLGRFAHLIVRFGVTAAIHCFNPGRNARYRLYYDVKCNNGFFREVDEEGGIIGNNSVFVASIIKSLLKRNKYHLNVETRIGDAIRSAIPACQRMHRMGYPVYKLTEQWEQFWPSPAVFDEYRYKVERNIPKDRLLMLEQTEPTTEDLIDEVEIPRGVEDWSILSHATAGAALMDTARNIVLFGVEHALNHGPRDSGEDSTLVPPRMFAPKARFNQLITLDRDEIESFRGVYNIIRQYLSSNQDKPLCLAIFGPPGSGKSFTVNQIALASKSNVIDKHRVSELQNRIDINVSQLESTKSLFEKLIEYLQDYRKQHRDLAIGPRAELGKVPFLFFDEFDCDHIGHLGWLKAFLSPMEDAIIPINVNEELNLSRSIMVFAGGTSPNYKSFSCETLPLTDHNRQTFIAAKGPDFISRLRGHIDIKGINPVSLSDKGYLIRRAVLLRQYMKDFGYTKESESANPAVIDYGVLDAMLMVDSYKHGARSMKALVAMCTPLSGRLEKASLPALPQLNMHVDSAEFHGIIREYRSPIQRYYEIDRHILT